MSEFNGKKYYGYSLHNDPTLLTTTRNFEFRYTRPENLERVIQKVQLSDGVENKHKKTLLAKYCKLKKPGARELAAPFQTHDLDVETHISRTDPRKVRNLSEDEIDQLIGKARSNVNMVSEGEALDLTDDTQHCQQQLNYDLKHLQVALESDEDATLNSVVVEEYRLPEPKWVEIEETSGYATLSLAELAQPLSAHAPSKSLSLPSMSLEQTQTESQKAVKRQQQQTIQTPLNNGPFMQSLTQKALGNQPQQQMARAPGGAADDGYYVEDSDYEYEMLKRPDYAKFCEKRPPVDDMTNVSHESGGIPRFIEVEHPHIPCMNLSFLKNAKPIRYTELTDEVLEDERFESSVSRYRDSMKVYARDAKQIEKLTAEGKFEKRRLKKDLIDKKEAAKKPKFPFKPIASELTSGALKASQTTPRKITKHPIAPLSPPLSPNNETKSRSARDSNRTKMAKVRNIVMTKSFEELKMEKVALFSRMNVTQERIVEMLDKLRINLLEVYVPDSHYDKNRRQKNAMEFSVRFSRNFLYPLRGMVDDIQSTTVEQINSSSSNEACIRVASIYALMLQSLQTYQRQLRFFLLDQVPQKLSALINLVYTTTNLCLEKGVFDSNDQIIECLLDRCSKFLGFLEDLHDERFMTIRENYRSNRPINEKKSNLHNKYDLKMFMNDLNMYEPKLVPKRQSNMRFPRKGTLACTTSSGNTTVRRRMKKIKKGPVEPVPVTSSELIVTSATEDTITTQVQKVDAKENSSELLSSIHNIAKSKDTVVENNMAEPVVNPLNKAIIEALQIVTKQQVRQVLEPIIQTLGTALNKKDFEYFIHRQIDMFHRMPITNVTLKTVSSNAL